jgi:hypothetical protein
MLYISATHGMVLIVHHQERNKTLGIMKKVSIASVLVLLVSLSGCQLIGDIFKAGVWAGVLMVVVVVVLIVFLLGKVFGGSK